MDIDNLIRMANRIGAFFAPMPERETALAGIADHLKKFWDPRMRRQILAAIDAGQASELDELLRAAIETHRATLTPAG